MSKQDRRRAQVRRAELVAILGSKCKRCGTTEKIEIDVIKPRGNKHHRKMSSDQRITFYYRQHAKKNVQLLCKVCNGSKGHEDEKYYQLQARRKAARERRKKELAQVPF